MEDLYRQSWVPDCTPRAHVLIVHGYAEHIGRYNDLATVLTNMGLQVHGYDHPGHGQSRGRRGDAGNFSALVARASEELENVRQSANEAPVFVLGHSMGGLIVAHLLAAEQTSVAGAILSSPLLALPGSVSPWLLRLAGFLSRATPWLPVERLDSAAISRVPEAVLAYDNDPLIYRGPVRARTGAALSTAIQQAALLGRQIDTPLIIIHGTGDQIAPVSGSQALYDQVASDDKTLRLFAGGYHELFNDTDGDAARAEVRDWLLARLPEGPTPASAAPQVHQA